MKYIEFTSALKAISSLCLYLFCWCMAEAALGPALSNLTFDEGWI